MMDYWKGATRLRWMYKYGVLVYGCVKSLQILHWQSVREMRKDQDAVRAFQSMETTEFVTSSCLAIHPNTRATTNASTLGRRLVHLADRLPSRTLDRNRRRDARRAWDRKRKSHSSVRIKSRLRRRSCFSECAGRPGPEEIDHDHTDG